MKFALTLSLGLALLGGSASAAVVDTIACTISMKDLKSGNKTQHSTEFEMARRSLSASPSPDIRLYSGIFKNALNVNQGNFKTSIDYNLTSRHAVKELGREQWDARQEVCVSVNYTVCMGDDPNKSCAAMARSCLASDDPFHETTGWSKVDMVDGNPTFNPLLLPTKFGGKIIYANDSVAEYQLDCAYKGTLD